MNSHMIISTINMVENRDDYSKILTALCMKLRLKMFMKNLIKIKKYFDFSNDSNRSKYFDDSNALVVGKMKDKMGDAAVEEFVG